MENASKALLIAAAILIVILIIAFAMKITNSTTDVTAQGEAVGAGLENQTDMATNSAMTAMGYELQNGAWVLKNSTPAP